jgi:hypothetical protein
MVPNNNKIIGEEGGKPDILDIIKKKETIMLVQ